MSDMEIQWHPGFVAAMNLELADNRDKLIYEKEYNLNLRPLEIDLLVIKKDKNLQLANEIGKIFQGYNIMEYKSPQRSEERRVVKECSEPGRSRWWPYH